MAAEDGRRGYVYHLGVLPQYRRRGIGEALVNAVLAAMERKSIATVALVASTANESCNAFWERMGFVRREDLTYRNRSLVKIGK